jgi:predicted transcriptional regulator
VPSDSEHDGVLERPRAIRTLVSLYETAEDAPASEVLESIGGSRTTGLNRLNDFIKLGLVEKQAGDNRTLYHLTEDGERVTEHLLEAISHIEDTPENDTP